MNINEIDKELLIETLIAIREALIRPNDYHDVAKDFETNDSYAYNKINDLIYSLNGDPYPSNK